MPINNFWNLESLTAAMLTPGNDYAVYREALDALQRLVPPGELVYGNGDCTAVRYLALRPLAHTFKDGYVYLYNKKAAGARDGIALHKLTAKDAAGYIDAWLVSDALWLFSDRPQDRALVERHSDIIWENATRLVDSAACRMREAGRAAAGSVSGARFRHAVILP